MDSIPVIDLNFITTANITENTLNNFKTKKVVEDIRNALHEVGFMYLINHSIPQTVIENAFKASKLFFNLGSETKTQYKKVSLVETHGWIQTGQELFDRESVCELRESFEYADPTKLINECPSFAKEMSIFKIACEQFIRKILLLLSMALEIEDVEFFVKNCSHLNDSSVANECVLRAIYYPAIPNIHDIPEGAIRSSVHTDFAVMSLLFQDDVGGLEVELADGKWVSVTPIPGSIIVNTGDLLEKWTGGYFPATKHRVIIPSTELKQRLPRYSIAYFLCPDNETMVAPITNSTICQTNNEIYNEPITAYEHIMNRVKNTEN